MGPGRLEGGVVLLRVEVGVITGRQRPEEVARDLQKKRWKCIGHLLLMIAECTEELFGLTSINRSIC